MVMVRNTVLIDKGRIIFLFLFLIIIGVSISISISKNDTPYLFMNNSIFCEENNILIYGYAPVQSKLVISGNNVTEMDIFPGNYTFVFVMPEQGNYTVLLISGNTSLIRNITVVRCNETLKDTDFLGLTVNETVCAENLNFVISGRVITNSTPYTGKVNLSIGNVKYYVLSDNGTFSTEIPITKIGSLNISAEVGNLKNSTSVAIIECNKVLISVDKNVYCSNETVFVTGYAKINGENYTGEGILVMKNGMREEARVMLINGLLPTYGFVNPSPDNYTVMLNVSGVVAEKNITVKSCENFTLPAVNESTTPENITRNLTAKENLSVQILGKNEFCDNESVRLEIKALLGEKPYTGEGSVKINSTVYSVFFENGTYVFSQNLSLGVYSVNASVNETFDYRVIAVRACANETFVNTTVHANVTARNETVNATENVTENATRSVGESYLILEIAKRYYEGEQIVLRGIAVINGTNYTGFVNLNISGKNVEYVSVAEARNGLFSLSLPMLSAGNYTIVAKVGEVLNSTEIEVVKRIFSRKSVETDFGDITLESEKGNVEMLAYEKGRLFLRITNLTKGERVKVRIILPFQIPQDYHLYFWKKVGNETKEIDYEILEDRRTVVLELEDGKLDEDGMANGIIVDPLLLPKPPAFQSKVLRKTPNTLEISVTEKSSSKWLKVQSSKGSLDVKVVDPENIPSVPKGTNFKFKLMKINISSLSPGESVDVYIRFSEPVSSIAEFWKFSASNLIWYRYPFERIDKYTIKITLRDGGEGDEDGVANGIIIDDAGLSDSWWNTSWLWRKSINITYFGKGNLTNYQIKLTIDTQTLISQDKMSDDCSDIRFTWWNSTSNIEQKIPYWMESECNTTQTIIWIKVPFIRNATYGNETVLMYYGNTTQVQSESNASDVFIYFDDGTLYSTWTQGTSPCTQNTTSGNPAPSYECVSGVGYYMYKNINQPYQGSSNEMRLIEVDMLSTGLGNMFFLVNSTGYGQMIRLDTRTTAYSGIAATNSWTSWECPGTAPGTPTCAQNPPNINLEPNGNEDSANTWYTFNITVNGTNVARVCNEQRNYCVETSSIGTSLRVSIGGLSTQTYIGLVGDGLGTSYYTLFDNIRIRKYAQPEPEVMIGGEEYVARLNVSIATPSEASVLTRYEAFWLNGTIYCKRSNCSNVYAFPEYITTGSELGKITEDKFTNSTEKINITTGDFLQLEPITLPFAWWNSTWNYRQCFNISSQNYETDYQVKVFFNSSDLGTNFDWNNRNGIRFVWYNSTGYDYRKIPYWIAEWNVNSNVTFWIRVPELTVGNTTVCMYYGNSTPVQGDSDPRSVFYFYSDGSDLNIFDVQQSGTGGSYSVNNTFGKPEPSYQLSVSGGTGSSATWTILGNTSNFLPDNYAVEADIYITGTSPLIDILTNFKAVSGPFYVFRFDARAGYYDLIGYYPAGGSSTTILNQTTVTSPTDTWLRMKAVRLNNILKLYKNDVLETIYDLSGTTYLITGGGIAITTDGATSTDWFDNIVVRKYSEPEPKINYIYTEENQTYKSTGYYISMIFDLGTSNIDFTNIYWIAQTNENTTVKVYTRTSEDNSIWSPWYLEVNNTDVDAPNRRYFQYKIELSTANIKQTPVFDKIEISYTYTAPAFVTMKSSGTDFTTSPVPYECGELNQSYPNCTSNWQVTPYEKGNYTLRIWVNSSNSNIAPAQSQWINVSVYERTYITEMAVEPNIQYKGGNVTISARLLDALSNPISGALINFTDETAGIIIGNDTTDSNGYATIVYQIPETTSIGYHTIRAEYAQNDTLYYFGSWDTVQLKVSSSPKFHSILLSDKNLGTKERERIQVNVTDEVGLDTVILYLTYPNGTQISRIMNYNTSTGYYEYTTEELWQAEDYYFYIWANNTDGISNSSWRESFSVKIIGRLDIAVEKDEYKNFEVVRLGTVSDEWDFPDYTWRDVIYVYSNESKKNAPIKININTTKIMNEGKLNSNCSDIRFIQTMRVYELPLQISNPYSEVKYDFTFPIILTDKETLSRISDDGRDIRIFSYQTNSPYIQNPDIPFWVESVTTTEAKIWVKLSELPITGTTLYLYYGNTSAESRSNYTAVFTNIIGEAGVVYHNDTWVNFKYLNASNEARFVFSSINTYYGSQEAFTRITKVNKTGFHVFIQESVGLDQTHAYENLGWLAVKNGTWVIGGKIWQTGNLSVTGAYTSVIFSESFGTEPVIISQIQSFVDTTPAKTRMDNPTTNSFSVKVEPGSTTDTFTSYENVAWLATEQGIYQTGALIEVGKKYHNQPVDVSSTGGWTAYTLTAGFTSAPSIVAKLMTENGGDNTHERIRNVGTTGFEYAMEEEFGHDGPHTYEWNGYFAVEPGKPIYGTKYYNTWPGTTEQTHERRVLATITTELPYWIESGCGSENTSIWVQLSYVSSGKNTIYMYHGNPSDGIVNNTAEDEIRVFTTDKTASYVVLGVQGSNLDIASYGDNNEITLGSTTIILNNQETYTFSSSDVSLGNLLYSESPVSSGTESAGDGAPLTPLAFKGKLFVFPVTRYSTLYLDFYAVEDAQVQVWVSDPAGNPWSLNDSFVLSRDSATSKGYVGSPDTDAGIELTYMINSTGDIVVFARQNIDDYLPLVPADTELYLEPSNYLELAAIEDGTSVTIYYSDGTSTTVNLNAGQGYTSAALGSDGAAPGARIVSNKPVFAYQLADSDGTEATPALPLELMDKVFVFPQDAEYFVAVTPAGSVTECTLYTSTGAVRAGPWTAAPTGNSPGKIGYGTAQDGTTYIFAGDKLVCNNSVYVYYEEAINDAETLLYGPKMHVKQFTYSYEVAYEEDKWVDLENNGNEVLRGYFWAIVQKWDASTGTWIDLPPAVINDRSTNTLREIAPGGALNLTQLWLDYGAWNTSDRENGHYRVHFSFVDPEGNTLYDYELRYLTDNARFHIVPANISLVNLTHNALAEHGIEEYETGDVIKWVNLTIKAYNNSAINTNVYLTLLDSANNYAGFGPENENYYCGLIYENTYCTAVFDNTSYGYPISENLGITNSANYVFKVNVTMKNGDDYINTSYSITVHNIPSTFSAILSPTRIYQNGDPAYYNFSFQNLWSRNITNASVKINCPNIVGFTCECLSNPGSSICDLGNVTQGTIVNVSFRISATEDVPQGDYIINVTVNYTNPLGNKKSWNEVESRTLEVRSPGILEITPYSYPASVTRGESAGFEAYANNTGSLTANQAWLAYSVYPSGWSITQGQENVTTTNLAPAQIFWNNVTFTLSINSALGAQQVKLESGSDIDQRDFKWITVYVYANTSLQIWVNDTNVSRGEGVRVYAKLLFDNSSTISGQNITFYDETDNIYLGWAITDANGIAYVDYAITDSTSLGLHILNASFSGNSSTYLNPSQNETQIDVGLKPFINSIEFLPSQMIGYGVNATIRANVTDDQGIDFVEIKITSPSGSVETGNMTLVGGNIYEYNYTDTWVNGTYTVEVIAHDIVGSVNSSTDYFQVKIYGGVVVKTEKVQYYPAETVKLAQAPVYPYLYEREILIENTLSVNLTEYQINIFVNTSQLISQGKMQSNCADIRFTWINKTSGREEEIPYYLDYGCNDVNTLTSVWIKIPVIYANNNTTVHMYYGNDQVQSASNETAVFSYAKNETTFYVVSFVSANSPLDVIAFENGTSVIFNGVAVNLDKGSTYQFAAGGSAALGVAHDKPIYGAFTNDVTDALSPVSWAGKRFIYRVYRGTNEWYIYAPFGGAEVNITDTSTGATTTVYVANGTAYNASVDITDGSSTGTTNAVIIESNVSILVQHAAPAQSYDSRLLYPASKELYGVPSQYFEVAAIEDGTTVNVYCSDGNTYSWNLNRGESAVVGGFGSEGTAAACVVKANKPVGANQLADSDGTETTTFLPLKELDRVYYLPQGAQYVAIAAPFSTTCNLYNPDGTLADVKSSVPNGDAPGKIFFGSTTDGTNIQAGSRIECTQPVFAYYEYSGTAGGDETNLFGMKANRKYAGIELNYTIGEETPSGSAVLNFAHEFKGYIVIEIQKNISGTWQNVATLLNDSATNTLRDFTSTIFDISNLAGSWSPEGNTGKYRIVAYVVNPDQSILNASKRKMLGSYEFDVVPVPLKLNISEIRVYEAPNNEHGGGTLIDSGINKTFNLEVGKTYRFEIDVSVLGDSHVWNISEANVTFENLNQSWIIDTQNHVWYLNATDSVERIGGIFSGGILKWNTSENNGLGENGTVVTFYFIINFTGAIAEERGTVFQIRGTDYIYRDFDTIKLYITDTTPPKLWNEIYALNASEILRGDAVKAFARWNEEISQALIEYNSTTSLLVNSTISLPSPNPENWTNYTMDTTSLWLLGKHVAKIYASDIAGNWNGTLPYLYFDVYGLAYVESIYVNDTSPTLNDYIEISCLVKDDTNTEIIENYNVTFWYDNAYIGYALTNVSGYATFVYQVTQPGEHVIKCNITNSSERYYKIDSRNFKEQTIFVNELEPPKWHEIFSPSLAHKGDYVTLAVNWTDNFALQAAKLATNASGSYQNVSELALSGTNAWANFTYQIPVSMQPGYLAWKQFANDTSGNENVTQEQIIEVWGWAKIDQAFVEPGSIQLGNSTVMYCHVVDANYTSYNVEGYTVNFYLGTAFLGSNTTNASGWAQYNFTPSQAGVFTVKCNISDYPAKKYNASEINEGSDTLTVTQTADVTPPKIVNDNYGLNTTSIYRYDPVLIYGQWNEEIDIGWAEFNTSQPNVFTTVYFNDSGTPGNWTNYTISTDDTWKPGVHVAKLYANDTSGNINDTLDYLSFEMWGRSAVYWIQPTQSVYRGTTTFICQVKDYDTQQGISDYTVEFYNSTTYLGSNTTNTTGYAQFTVDTTSYTPGVQTFYCKIIDDPSKYYSAVVTQASYDVEIRGKLNVTIVTPQTNAILERGLNYWLNSSTVDEFGNYVTPDTANWYDNEQSIGTGENISWNVPLNHSLGITTIKINVTKAYYDSDEDLRNVYIYGHAKAKWISPNNGSYPQGVALTLECFVNDSDVNSGIANYPVNFYYNGTLIDAVLTNSSGYAKVTWNTAGLQGTYNVSCVIEDNSTLYYLASQPLDNTFIEIYVDTTPPTVTIISPENKSYATTSVNLNYTATDDRSLDQCWYSLDNGANISLPNCENTTLTSLSDGSHKVRVYANDSAGNVGYAEQFFTVDTQAPVITIVSPKNKTYAQSWVWGNVSLNEKASLCWYSLDSGTNVSMQNTTPAADYWYANVSSLSEGAHEIAFYCNDTAGNENATSVVFTVDTTPPSVYLLEPVDNAVLNTDYITFICNASDSISLRNVSLLTNESGTLSIVQTNTSGVNGNYTFSRSVQDGAYLWTCKACDAVHCVFAGENRTVVADTQAPNVTIYSPQNTSYATSSVNLNYTAEDLTLQNCWYSLDNGANISLPNCENTTLTSLSDGSHKVRVYANDSLGRENFDEVYFTVDTTPPQVTVVSPVNNTEYGVNIIDLEYIASDNLELTWCGYSLDSQPNVTLANCENTTLTGLSNGIHNVTVYVRDIAGNENASFVNFSVNSVAPVVNIIHPEDFAYYASNTVNLNYTASDADLDQCWYSLDNGANISLPNCENTTLTSLSDGSHKVRVYANDSQAHESYDEVTFYVDTVAPSVTIVSPENKVYTSSSVWLNYTASDANLEQCWYSLDNGANISLPNCENTTLTSLSDGSHKVRVYANDSAGNVGYAEQFFTVDTQAPVITIVSPEDGATYLTNTINVNYTVTDNLGVDTCWYKLDGGENVYLTNCENFTLVNLVDGTHSLVIYANDTGNNVNSSGVLFTIDTQGPVITFVSPTPDDNQALDYNWTYVNITTNEDTSIAFLEWNYTNGTVVNYTMNTLTSRSFWFNVTDLNDGTYYYRVYANDSYNHWSASGLRSVRISTTAPVIDILSPQSKTYSTTNYIPLEVVSNKPIDTWWFSINGKANETFTPNTSIAAKPGTNELYVYANDTAGRIGWSSISFTVNATLWQDYFATKSGINQSENASVSNKLSIDFCWYIEGKCYLYRKPMIINNSQTLTDFQVNLTVDTQNLISASKMNSTCKDIRFTWINMTNGEEKEIPYYLEGNCNTTQTKIWIRLPEISAGNTTVYMYYGNMLVESESNSSEVFDSYSASQTCSGSTTGGSCPMAFNAPAGYEFYSGSVDLEAAGDLGFGGSYADNTTCAAGETYERFNVTVEGSCYGVYSPGIDGCTLTHISTWPKDVSQDIRGKTSFTVTPQVNSKVNADPATCGFYYYFRTNLSAEIRKQGYVDKVFEEVEESRKHNAWVKTILIKPLKLGKWEKFSADHILNNGNITYEVYNWNNVFLVNCTSSPSNCDLSGITSDSIYVKIGLFTKTALNGPEVYNINITWNISTPIVVNSYNSSYHVNPNTRIEIYDKNNNLVASGYGSITASLEIYENYTYKSFTPVSDGLGSRIYNLNISKMNLKIEEQVVENYAGFLPSNVSAITPIYALNDTGLAFEKAKLVIPKNGVTVQNVLHCIAWDFVNANCSQWEFIDPANLEGYGENATHIWFNVTSFEAFTGASTQPDLVANNIMFNISQENIVENQVLMITANVSEEAGVDATNVTVQLDIYSFNGTVWILKQTNESVVNITANTYELVNFTWIAKPGTWNFSVTVDPANTISETNESNNFNSTTYNVSGWAIYYGHTNGWIAIKDSAGNNFSVWIPMTQQGNLYFADYDSDYAFADLMPLNGTNDFTEADQALNMTGFSDSVEALYDKNNDGVADTTACFEIGSRTVCDVPVINSTDSNNGNFITGILWDSGDGGTEYNGTQDLIFITKINSDAQGTYGTYDYEARIPALLRDLKGTNDLIKIFMEVK